MRPIHVSLSLGLILIAAGCQDNGEPKKDNGEPEKPEIKISDVFRDQMMKFFEVSGELEAATGQGVNILAFKEHLAKAKSSYELVSATWPDGFQPDARKSFDKAIEGWKLALRLWAGRIAKHDAPTEPNINGYAEYMAYAGDSLKTGTWGSFLKEYEGKKKINQSDDNVGVLLIMGSTHSKVGKASVLSALSKN